MAAEQIVDWLALFMVDEGRAAERRYGPSATAALRDMVEVLNARIENESAYADVWEDFQASPQDNTAELAGALETLAEADPALARRLNAFAQEFEAVQEAPAPRSPVSERRLAESGGDALDTAISPEQAASQQPGPYSPNSTDSASYHDSEDDGTYLYGNVESGRGALGSEAGVETFDLGTEQARSPEVAAVSGIPGLFEELATEVKRHPDLSAATKEQVLAELSTLQEQVMHADQPGGTANSEALIEQIESLSGYAPDIGAVILRAMETIDLPAEVRKAVERARSTESVRQQDVRENTQREDTHESDRL